MAERSRTDRINWALMSTGWRVAPHLPGPVMRGIARVAGRAAEAADLGSLATYRANLEVALGRPVAPGLLRHGLRSYLRTWTEVLALSGWSRSRIVDSVVADPAGERVLREAAAGPGVVVALPHTGNWDLAGAWACCTGLPVSTVAEQLGEREFAAFTRLRTRLGMKVLSHRDPHALSTLVGDVKAGRVVCLIADRDLLNTGIEVDWPTPTGTTRVRMPAGPAMIARRSGATLLGAACSYRGQRMHIAFSEPVPQRPGRDGLTAMTQDLATFFAGVVQRQPQDWHMMQPFFPEVRERLGG